MAGAWPGDAAGETPLRFGLLGAAKIAPAAIVRPAQQLPAATVVAVAARDPARAEAFARRHGVPKVHARYEDVLADPDIDAIYNPLPNSLHGEWTLRALQAGKHVLCEKPLAANADEAQRMAAAAKDAGLVLMEAFHYRYHPLTLHVKQILDSGELGRLRQLESAFCIPLVDLRDIRYRSDLAGGATMDVGCYPIHLMRFLTGTEPEVIEAKAQRFSPQIDRVMTARFRFPDGSTGKMFASLLSPALWRADLWVLGEEGELRLSNPFLPHLYHRLWVKSARGRKAERLYGDTTYTYQLRAFVAAVRQGTPLPTDAEDGVKNMRVIDDIYRRAGLEPRGAL